MSPALQADSLLSEPPGKASERTVFTKKSHRNETCGTFSRSVGKSSAIPPITIGDNALVLLEQ